MKLLGCLLLWLSIGTTVIHGVEEPYIIGSDNVEIAMVGESIEEYKVPEGFSIRLQKKYPGVLIEENGKLIVRAQAQEGVISIVADNGEQQITKNVMLHTSWTKQTEGGEQYQIPETQKTRRIWNMELQNYYLPIPLTRIVLIGCIVGVYMSYLLIRRKS